MKKSNPWVDRSIQTWETKEREIRIPISREPIIDLSEDNYYNLKLELFNYKCGMWVFAILFMISIAVIMYLGFCS